MIQPYIHKVQYYETDQMGIVHHGNYILWYEEARVDWMEQMGYGYYQMEQDGITSPVLSITSEYQEMVRFGESVSIVIKIKAFNGIRLHLAYEVYGAEDGKLKNKGESTHCFLDVNAHPISLKKTNPKLYAVYQNYAGKE